MSTSTAARSYEEPSIDTILIYASFLLLLNVVNHGLDKVLYCGLVGQIVVGIGWGAPGTDWLPREAQDTIMQLGYLGLILLVYEGTETMMRIRRCKVALAEYTQVDCRPT
jgi:hypothetical protein